MPRPQNRIKRFVSRSAFTDNSRIIFDLPRDYDYEAVGIYINGKASITVAGTAVRAEAPLQAVANIALKANGSDLLDSMPGVMAHKVALYRRGAVLPTLIPPSAATVGTKSFECSIILDRNIVDGLRPKDANFPSRGLSTFQLEVVIGTANSLFTGTPTATFTSSTIDVFVIQSQEMPGQDGKVTLPRVVTQRSFTNIPFASSNANYQHRLTTGNLLRGVLLRSEGSVTAGEPASGIVNNVKIMQGNNVMFDLPATDIAALNATDFSLATFPTGFLAIDFMNSGALQGVKLADALDVRRGEEVFLMLDVTGGTNVNVGVMTTEYMPYAPAYWGLKV